MSKGLSATILTEIAKKSGVSPRTLFRFYLDGGTVYLTSHDHDLTFDSQSYNSWRVSHSGVKTYLENKVDNCTVTIDNTDLSMSAYFAAADFSGRKAEILKIFLTRVTAQQDGAVDKAATTITLKSVSGTFPAAGGTAYMSGEKFTFTGVSGATLTGCSARRNTYASDTAIWGEYPLGTASDYEMVFRGVMDTPSITEKNMTVRIVSQFDRSKSYTPWRRFMHRCNWQFCGTECGYNSASKPSGTADSGTTSSLTDAALVGISSMVGGLVKVLGGTNRGASRYITAHNTTTGQISWSTNEVMAAACDNTTRYIIDCDKTKSACSGFGNTAQFGGFDLSSKYNITAENIYSTRRGIASLPDTTSFTPIVYGYAMVKGVLTSEGNYAFMGSTSQQRVYSFCEGEIDSFEDIFVNGVSLLGGSTWQYYKLTGTTSQVVTSTDMGNGFYWLLPEVTYYQRRTAFCIIRSAKAGPSATTNWDYYFNQVLSEDAASDEVLASVKGLKVQAYDSAGNPSGAPAWSQNPIWCIIDFLLNRASKKLTSADIDWAVAAASASTCTTNGYRLNLSLLEQKKDSEVLDILLAACRGYVTYSSGKMQINLEQAWSGPAAHTFDDTSGGADNIVKNSFRWHKKDLNDVPNRIVVKYKDEEIRENMALLNGYLLKSSTSIPYSDIQGTFTNSGTIYLGTEAVTYTGKTGTTLTGCSARSKDYPSGYPIFQGKRMFPEMTAVYNDEDAQDKSGRVIEKNLDGAGLPTYDQAYKYAEWYGRKQVEGNVYCDLRGMIDSLDLTVGAVVNVTHTLPGWSSVSFRVSEASESEDDEVDYVLQYYDASFYSENSVSPGNKIGTTLPNPFAAIDQVTGLAVSELLYAGFDGTYLSRLLITYSPPESIFFDGAEVHISLNGGTYRNLGRDYSQGTSYIIDGPLGKFELGDSVTIRVASVSSMGVVSDYASAPTYTLTILGKYAPPSIVTGFTATIENDGIRLRWTPIADVDVWAYEIRLGSVWEGAALIASGVTKETYFWWPTTSGSLTFLIKSIDTTGNYATNAASVAVLTSPPSQVTNLTAEIIDNNVLLKWTGNRGTFPIKHYELRKGATFATAETIGTVPATFSVVFETAAGTYTYWIVGVDICDVYGSERSISASVSEPPNYELLVNWSDDFLGTRTNMAYEDLAAGRRCYANVDIDSTVEEKFTALGATTVQDLIDAGYTYFLEPSLFSGAYERVMDYGATIGGCSIKLSVTVESLSGSALTVWPTISTSPDNVTYTDYEDMYQVFAGTFRYVKIRLEFNGASGDIGIIRNMTVKLDVKLKDDSGNGAISVAADGKVVRFNKDYMDISAIGVNGRGSTFALGIADFVDSYGYTIGGCTTTLLKLRAGDGANYTAGDWVRVPLSDGTIEYSEVQSIATDDLTISPAVTIAPGSNVSIYHASFRAYLFDAAGTKITGSFSWQAKGY